MKLNIIAVGKRMPKWTIEATSEYQQRLPKDFAVQIHEIAAQKRPKNYNPDPIILKESQAIQSIIPKNSLTIACDVAGKTWDTPTLAKKLNTWQHSHNIINFIIGGPDGLSQELLNNADELWSLSRLTFPHPLVRVVLMEQLYRAWSINQGHPYHRE